MSLSPFRNYSIGYISRFRSVTLHNGIDRCAIGFIGGTVATSDSRILLPNGTIYDPNLRSDGSYNIPTNSGTLPTFSQEYMYSGTAAQLDDAYSLICSYRRFVGTVIATTIGGNTFTCEAQLAQADNSRTTPGYVNGGGANRHIFFTLTWYMLTGDWTG